MQAREWEGRDADNGHREPRPAEVPASNPWEANADQWRQTDQLIGDEDNSHVADMLGIVPGCRLLDAGCGAGRRAQALLAAGTHVVGIDTAPTMLKLASAAIGSQHLLQADVAHLPFEGSVFDAALCAYVLDFTADAAAGLRELHRVVRSDGRLLVSVLGAVSGPRRSDWRRFIGEPQITSGPLPWEMESLLGNSGWQVLYQEGVFGRSRDGRVNPITDPTVVDPVTWKAGLQALADGWRFLAVRAA